jgi:hypothetical protein
MQQREKRCGSPQIYLADALEIRLLSIPPSMVWCAAKAISASKKEKNFD